MLENVDPDEVAARRAPIADFVAVFEEAGIDCEVRGVVGSYADAIVDLATEVEADRIVVGGRAPSSAGKAVFGSTSQEIMHSAPCPVTYVGDRGVFESGRLRVVLCETSSPGQTEFPPLRVA